MNKCEYFFVAVLVVGLGVAGCSSTPTSQNLSNKTSHAANALQKRMAPVVAERPARIYIWAGFDEKNCQVLTPKITISQQPSKGVVNFRENQMTIIKHSNSGKCLGQKLPGTGIYYTARKGQTGSDHFSLTASTSKGHSATRSFQIRIVE